MTLVIVRLGIEDNIDSLVKRIEDAGIEVPDRTNEFRASAGYGLRAYQLQVSKGTTVDQLEPLLHIKDGEVLEIGPAPTFTELKC